MDKLGANIKKSFAFSINNGEKHGLHYQINR